MLLLVVRVSGYFIQEVWGSLIFCFYENRGCGVEGGGIGSCVFLLMIEFLTRGCLRF